MKNIPIIIQRKALLAVLKNVRAAVSAKGSSIEQAEHFIILDDQVLAWNDSICVRAPLGIKTELKLTVPASVFWKMLKEIPEDEIMLELDQNHFLVIRSSSGQVSVKAHPVEGEILSIWIVSRRKIGRIYPRILSRVLNRACFLPARTRPMWLTTACGYWTTKSCRPTTGA